MKSCHLTMQYLKWMIWDGVLFQAALKLLILIKSKILVHALFVILNFVLIVKSALTHSRDVQLTD
jgi:hypothetical protein